MLNLHQLERLLDEGQYHQLVDRILANGRATEPSLRKALMHPAILTPIALGLALQRACELSYGPSDLAGRILRRLLDLQLPDGRFGSERSRPCHSIIATAVALRGLLDYQHQLAFFRPLSFQERVRVRVSQDVNSADSPHHPTPSSVFDPQHSNRSLAAAVERTVGALAAAVAGEIAGLPVPREPTLAGGDDPLHLRIAAWQLGPHRTIVWMLGLSHARPTFATLHQVSQPGRHRDEHRAARSAA